MLSLVAGVFDILDRSNANLGIRLGIRDRAATFRGAVLCPLTAEEDRRMLHSGALSCVPLLGVKLAASPSLLRVFGTGLIPDDCWRSGGIFDSLRGDEVSAGLLGRHRVMSSCCRQFRGLQRGELLERS